MQALPHFYKVQANSKPDEQIISSSTGIPSLVVAGPAEFDGPGDQWSPETLMMSAIASCFVLSFKAVANASKFPWKNLECESVGQLEKVQRVMAFTEVITKVRLVISDSADKEKALKLLEKSEAICIVTNSLNGVCKLECDIVIEA